MTPRALSVWALAFLAASHARAHDEPPPGGAPSNAGGVSSATTATPPEKASAPPSGDEPFRLHEVMAIPWLRIGLEQRARFEYLHHDFRTTATDHAMALTLRTLLPISLRLAPVVVGAELIDARVYAREGTRRDNGMVDAVDILQLYAGLQHEGLVEAGDEASLRLGRFTLDVGSRRAIARNEFRNTINAFTGIEAGWKSPAGHVLRAFAVRPVTRLPADPEALERNRIELDRENTGALLAGLFFGSSDIAAALRLESYLFAVYESDRSDAPSSDRRLAVPGLRIFRPPAPGRLDLELEAIVQLGSSRASVAARDTTDLIHRAGFAHASLGYRFDLPLQPRVALRYDFASGDRDPGDGRNERYDPLFGARRFELGPTGLYGALPRSNMSSPGLHAEVEPHPSLDAFAAYRPVWVASARDAWMTAGLRDPSGRSGTFLGHHLEGRIRWHILPSFSLDVGAAYLLRGEFAERAPGGSNTSPVYSYGQLTGSI